MLIYNDPQDEDKYHRYIEIVTQESNNTGNWVVAGEGTFLTDGIYLVPSDESLSFQADDWREDAFSIWSHDEYEDLLLSPPFKGVRSEGGAESFTYMAFNEAGNLICPEGDTGVPQTPKLVLAVGEPNPADEEKALRFNDPNSIAGILMRRFGGFAVLDVNDFIQSMRKAGSSASKGFTLLEVVIALAVFAFLIGGLLGFLPWSVEGVSKVREQDTAYGLVDAVQIELERMGFSLVEAGTNRLAGLYEVDFIDRSREDVQFDLLLVASRSGGAVAFEQVVENQTTTVLNSDQLDEGPNQDFFQKEKGGVVFLTYPKMMIPFRFTDMMMFTRRLIRGQQGGYLKRTGTFLSSVLNFHWSIGTGTIQVMAF